MSSIAVPSNWFHRPELQYENHKPNFLAILILATIVYWYRPTAVRDTLTGSIVGGRYKFCSDKLQMSYAALSHKYGFTRSQVHKACHFLANRGLVTLEFRHSKAASNLLFIEPVVENIKDP
jgi:hypothetical protein